VVAYESFDCTIFQEAGYIFPGITSLKKDTKLNDSNNRTLLALTPMDTLLLVFIAPAHHLSTKYQY